MVLFLSIVILFYLDMHTLQFTIDSQTLALEQPSAQIRHDKVANSKRVLQTSRFKITKNFKLTVRENFSERLLRNRILVKLLRASSRC